MRRRTDSARGGSRLLIACAIALSILPGTDRSAFAEEGLPSYVLLLDRSGSMDERPPQWGGKTKKIEAVRERLAALLSAIPDGTEVEAILFDHEVVPGPSLILRGPNERQEVAHWFANLAANPKGGTFAWRSLDYAVGRARAHLKSPGAWVRLLMLTDGEDLEPDSPQRPKTRLVDVLARNRDVLQGPIEATLITLGFELKNPAERKALVDAGVPVVAAMRPEELLPLLPEFAWGPESPVRGRPVLFADRTQGPAASYSWDFGTAGRSTEKSPIVVFRESGQVRATLTVTGHRGLVRRISHTLLVREPEPLKADLRAWPAEVAPGALVQFVSDSLGPVASCIWDFGDGEPGAVESHPRRAYRAAGTYSVRLTVRDGDGRSDTCEVKDAVRVVAPAPPQAVLVAPQRLLVDEAGTFVDQSTGGAVLARYWDFGDGTPTGSDPVERHAFARPGKAHVVLKVRGADGQEAAAAADVQVVAREVPPARAWIHPEHPVVGQDVVFVDESGGLIERADWAFSAGEPESRDYRATPHADRSVVRRFAVPGEVRWTLSTTAAGGTSETEGVVVVALAETPPTANFSAGVLSGTAPLEVVFENTSHGGRRFTWDFGDGAPQIVQEARGRVSHRFGVGEWRVRLRAEGAPQFSASQMEVTVKVAAPVPTIPPRWPWVVGGVVALAALILGVPMLRRAMARWSHRRAAWRVSGKIRVRSAVEGVPAREFLIRSRTKRFEFDPGLGLPSNLAARAPRKAALYVASVDAPSLSRSLAIDLAAAGGTTKTLALDRNDRGGHGGLLFEVLR